MTALFARAGIDYEQWKAVSRTLLRADFRPPGGQSSETYSLRTAGGLLLMAAIYGLFGLTAAVLVVLNRDALLTGIVTLTYLAFLVSTSILTQHGSTVFSTTDYAILGPRPVSSRTFLAIRITNILFHVTVITTLMGHPAILAFTVAHGVSIARGIAAAVALYAWAVVVTLSMVTGYATVLRVVGAARLQRALGYAQLLIGVVAYGGFVFLTSRMGQQVIVTASLPREPWLILVPPAWYASYLEIATGSADGLAWACAAISLLCLAALFAIVLGQLGPSYGERLGALAIAAPEDRTFHPRQGPPRGFFFRRDESRAAALLIGAHFRHDMKTRLGVLSIVPMTLLYLFLGVRDGPGTDPFAGAGAQHGFDFISLAVLMFPAMLTQQLSATDAYEASWIYFVTAADRGRVIVAATNVITVFFIVPFVAFLAIIFAWRFGHAGHALVHAGCLGLVSYLALQVIVLVRPRLPFATAPRKSGGNAAMFLWMMFVVGGGTLLLFWLRWWVYENWMRVAVFVAACLALSWVVNRGLSARAARATLVPAL